MGAVARLAKDARVRVAALVCACFLLGSTGWLSWLRHLSEMAGPTLVDLYTMVLGYLSQAAGIGLFMLLAAKLGHTAARRGVVAFLVAYVVLLDPATTSSSLAITLAFGWLMNICCGVSQGYYLTCLASVVEAGRRGVVFGGAYAASTLFTWVLSGIGGGILAEGVPCLAVCAVLAIASIVLAYAVAGNEKRDEDGYRGQGVGERGASESEGLHAVPAADRAPAAEASLDEPVRGEVPGGQKPFAISTAPASSDGPPAKPARGNLLVLAGLAVVFVSLVKNAGFSFPAADLSGVVNLELSRLLYGVGLIAAGIVADRDRRLVLALCAVSLVVPFLMLALTGAGATGVILWAIGYLLFGFFTVFRITLFADLAARDGRMWLSGGGLLLGRMGDVMGTALCLALAGAPLVLISVTSALFLIAAGLLVTLYRRLYNAPEAPAPEPVRDVLGEFCMAYDLSAREREVLPLLVQGKTNAEIAAALYVTESTVKYHVRNIRAKTGCSTRLDVTNLYIASQNRPHTPPA